MTAYYERGGITIYHGKCEDIVPALAFDAILTDPPYGIGLNFGDGSTDTAAAFRNIVAWLPSLGVPTAFTVPSTKLFDVPRPDWIGVWHKPMTFGFWSTPLIPHWEAICFYAVPPKMGRSDVWVVGTEKPNGHPTPKPLRLWREILAVMPAGVVLDPFAGSGTTARAAMDLGRAAICIDVEERYCELMATRLQQAVLPLEAA